MGTARVNWDCRSSWKYKNHLRKTRPKNQSDLADWGKEQLLHLYHIEEGTPSAGCWWPHLTPGVCVRGLTDRELLTVPEASVWLSLHCWHGLSITIHHLATCGSLWTCYPPINPFVCRDPVLSFTPKDFTLPCFYSWTLWLDNSLTHNTDCVLHFYQLPSF